MADRVRTALERLDGASPADDVYRRALDGPHRPDPIEGPSRSKRVIAGVTAFAVFGLAAGFAWRALRPVAPPTQPAAPAVQVATLGEDGTTLWPARTAVEIKELQAEATKGGRFAWLLDPAAVTSRFAERVLGWEDVSIEDTTEPGTDPSIVTLRVTKAGDRIPQCPPQPIDRCLGGEEIVTLARLTGSAGEENIFAITEVRAPSASLDVVPGQIVRNGATLSGHQDVSDGLFGSWGTDIGSYRPHHNCSVNADFYGGNGQILFPISMEPDAETGTDCGPRVPGYVWLATATWGEPSGRSGNPFDADSSPYVSITAVPLVVSIPENEPQPGMSTYVDPVGWSADYPSDWIVTPFEVSTFGPMTTISGAAISNLPLTKDGDGDVRVHAGSFDGGVAVMISHGEVFVLPRFDTTKDDSTFPLDPADAEHTPGDGILSGLIRFQGNGLEYSATFGSLRASDEDVVALEDVIRSIRFPALADGKQANGWESLGPADDYAPGKGASALTESLGLVYVLRDVSDDGTHVLDLDPDSCGVEGANETWDPETGQVWLQCPYPGGGPDDVRYNPDGTPDPGNPGGFRRTLDTHPVILAWNGTLLMRIQATSCPSATCIVQRGD